MSTDIAALGVKVDFSSVTGAIDALNKLRAAAAGAATLTTGLTQASAPANVAQAALAKTTASTAQATTALNTAIAPAIQAHNALTVATTKATAAHHGHGAAMQANSIAALEFMHVARSLTEQIASGVNPVRALTVEFGRLTTLLQYGGGASGVLSMAGTMLGKLLNPAVLLTGAFAGLGVAGAAAFVGWESRLTSLQNSLNGVGRSTGLTLGALNRAAVGAAGSGTSIATAQGAFATLTATGQIGAGLSGNLVAGGRQSVISQYANATGSSYSDATKNLAADFADPTKGADALNKQFGFLNDATRQLIANLDASGRSAEAQRVLLTSLKQGLSGATDQTWGFANAWNAVTGAVSNASSAVGAALQSVLDPSLDQRYASAVAGYAHYKRDSIPGQILGTSVEDLGEQLRRRGQAASQLGRDTNADQRSQEAGDLVRRTISEIGGRQGIVNQRDSLRNALNTPGVRSALDPDTASAADDALARLNARIDNFATAAQRVTQDSAIAAQAIQAQTAQERTAIDALKAFNDVMRDTGDKSLAAAQAQAKWNEAIATSNKQAEDALRSAQENSTTAGMRPYERSRAEIDYRYRNLARDSVTGPVSMLSPGDLSATALDDRTTPLARAMLLGSKGSNSYLDAAGTLSSAGGKITNRVVPTVHAVDPFADHFAVPLGSMAYDYGGGSSDVTVSGGRRVGSYAPAASSFAPGNIALPGAISSTSAGTLSRAHQLDLSANDVTQIVVPLREAQDAIDAQNRLLAVQRQTWGQMPTVITEATEKTKLLNDEIARGVPRTAMVLAANQRVAAGAADVQKQQIDLQNRTDAQNSFRDLGSQFVGGAANDIFSTWNSNPRDLVGQLDQGDQAKFYGGQLSGNQVKNMVRQKQIQQLFASIIEKQGVSMIETGLFGNGKQGNNGVLGGIFGALTGGLFGGGASASVAGAGGGLFAGIGKMFGFADGGIMTPSGPLMLHRYVTGGVTNGPQLALSGERGAEAYIPLPDGRTVPVSMKGGGNAPTINMSGHTIIVQGNADAKTASMIDAKLAAANTKMLSDLQRNIGPMVAKYNQRNG